MINVRTLRDGEAMPQHLGTGFESMPVMNSFVWVAEQDERIVGILMAAPCHGLLFLVRLRVLEGSPATVTLALFRRCIRDSKEMGFRGYFSYIDPQKETEAQLIPICIGAGGIQVTQLQVPLVGSLEKAARF
jgi:hypothetical protein